jgi:hypothetical protein
MISKTQIANLDKEVAGEDRLLHLEQHLCDVLYINKTIILKDFICRHLEKAL